MRRKVAAAITGLAAVVGALVLALGGGSTGSGPRGLTQGGGGIDVFVGSTPTPVSTPTPTATPGASVANLWVDGAGTCTRQSSAGAYNNAQACDTLASAHAASSADDVIAVKDKGSAYADVVISGTHGTSGHPVVITAAAGETPVTGELDINASNVTVRDMETNWYVCKASNGCPGISNIILLNVVNEQGLWFIRNSTNVQVIGGVNCCKTGPGNTPIISDSTNVTFDGVLFYTYRLNQVGEHVDCMGIFGGNTNVTIKNSRFYDCEHYGILVDNSNAPESGNAVNQSVVLENNIFEDTVNASDPPLGFSKCHPGCVIRFNTFGPSESMTTDSVVSGSTDGAAIYGNIFGGAVSSGGSGCTPPSTGMTWTNNLFVSGSACSGTGNITGSAGWVSTSGTAGASDFHLSSCGAAAVNAGGATSPSADYDGVARPVGSASDIGAFERAGC